MYCKCGSIEDALRVFKHLLKSNVITWNAIISGLAMHSRVDDALDYFSKMERAGVVPSDVTYIGILSACSHAGLVEKGRAFFIHMINVIGLEPRVEHYGCMVDLLGRAGLLEEAEELILNMPIQPNDVTWKALLGACKMQGNIEMGKRNWEAVANVRLRMKDMDIRKEPGGSLIELDGAIHKFVVEDESHHRAGEIHSMLEEISEKLSLEGHRPNTTQVLLNMDEEEKQSALHYHSEKIATALGLISTAPRTSLRIFKNLRICEDCHSSIKLISKIYKCKIVVRDRKRFHHFENGLCSCKDYW
ncbi:hypothetical protein ACFX2I_003939 [Malus domestica]